MNNTFNDQFLLDYDFTRHPDHNKLVKQAEARERSWYVMLKRLNGVDKFSDGKTINADNMKSMSVPSTWKKELKEMLLTKQQTIKNIATDNTVIQITDAQVQAIWKKLMSLYSQPAIMQALGLDLLYDEVINKRFHNNKDNHGAMTGAMLNGLKTELAQMLRRTEWSKQWDVNVSSNTVSSKQTFDLTFRGAARGREMKADPANKFPHSIMTDIPFEVKTQLSRFHVLGIHNQFLTQNVLVKNKIDVSQEANGQNTATVYIDKNKLISLIDGFLFSKLEASPVYESPATLMLPSELLEAFDKPNQLKIFIDTAALMGARVEDMELIDRKKTTELKYHLWYGR